MMSDNIIQGTQNIIGGIGRVLSATVRGAVLFGLIAFSGGTLLMAAGGIIAACGAGAGLLGGLALAGGAILNAALGAGISCAMVGAVGGAALLGVTSLIPSGEGFNVKKLFSFNKTPQSPAPDIAPSLAPQYDLGDNPYAQPGLGARLAQRGSERSAEAGRGV